MVELGVGLGALTRELAEVASKVIGIEIDPRLVRWLETEALLPSNVELRQADMLKVSLVELTAELGGPLRIVGNLPYYLSTQIVFKLWEEREHVDWATLMFQKEVAHRLLAIPGSKDYGILSVLLGGYARLTKILELAPTHFWPRPQVASTVIKIEFVAPPWPVLNSDFLRRVVRQAFGKRRKTLANALKGLTDVPEEMISKALATCEICPTRRAETLEIKEFVCIANTLWKFKRQNVLTKHENVE